MMRKSTCIFFGTAIRYRDEILDPIVRPYAGAVGPTFILMDDNARPHRARVVQQYLEQQTIEWMDWPARSPDMNPIEHVWDMLGRALASRQRQPVTLDELQAALEDEWRRLPQDRVRRLIASMPRRCRSLIEAHGHHTRY